MEIIKLFLLKIKALRLRRAPFSYSLILLFSLCGAAGAANYDAFTSETARGLDYIAVRAKKPAAAGSLGNAVYDKGPVETDQDVFIPTDFYVRLGGGANFGIKQGVEYDWGFFERFALGANFSSWARGELALWHQDLRWTDSPSAGSGTANIDGGDAMLYFDLARRYRMRGDIMYRRRVVPFIGIGAAGGYADFAATGFSGFIAGGRAAAGFSFLMTETNAIDLSAKYEFMTGPAGFEDGRNTFGLLGASLSWRSSF
ncbi:MAG: hypothetical protein LBL46_02260 [Rickettsiales bacterium]|jgi:hypothetical protein|nr:hypothetical protein [Rickettsiales bacterium]